MLSGLFGEKYLSSYIYIALYWWELDLMITILVCKNLHVKLQDYSNRNEKSQRMDETDYFIESYRYI
jgi:hypothetical protein